MVWPMTPDSCQAGRKTAVFFRNGQRRFADVGGDEGGGGVGLKQLLGQSDDDRAADTLGFERMKM